MSNFQLKYNPSCPIDVFNHTELNNNEKIIYMVIHNIIGSKERKCTLNNEDIANASNTSIATTKRAISNLVKYDLIWLDVDRKRIVKNPNDSIRYIYTNYKYYTERNNKVPPIPTRFKSQAHFKNWATKWLPGFTFRAERHNGNKLKVMITNSGYLMNIGLDEELHPIDEKGDIYKIWADLYKNKDVCIEWYKENKLNKKEEK